MTITMNIWTLIFIGAGIAVAVIGACIFQFNRGAQADDRLRQTGLIFFAAGLVIALLSGFGAGTPHSH